MNLNVRQQQTHMRSLVLSALIMSQLSYANRCRYQYLLSEKYLPEAGMHCSQGKHTLKKTNLLRCARKAKIKRRRQRA